MKITKYGRVIITGSSKGRAHISVCDFESDASTPEALIVAAAKWAYSELAKSIPILQNRACRVRKWNP